MPENVSPDARLKKNVLHLIPSFHQGGSERQALQLARLQRVEGSYNIEIACLDTNGILKEEAEESGFKDIPEFPLNSFYDLNAIVQLRRFVGYLKERKIDIIQTHDFYSNVFGMAGARLANVPVRIAAKRETGMRSPAQLFIERRAFGLANAVVVNSERVRGYLLEAGVPERKLKVVYNGIDTKRFDISVTDRGRVLDEMGIPSDRIFRLVTMVANLRDRVKNHEMFLMSAAKVAKAVDDAGFVIAGEGSLSDEMKALACRLGLNERAFFIGRCTRVPELLALSEICVLTSRSEGFSNSIVEYMAAGRAVVATDVGGAAEAVVEGETGFLVESDDDQSLAERVCRLLENPEMSRRMGGRGKKRIAEHFSMAAQLENTLSIYEQELGRIRRS